MFFVFVISYFFPSPEYDWFKFNSCSSLAFQLAIFPFMSLEIGDKQEGHGITATAKWVFNIQY